MAQAAGELGFALGLRNEVILAVAGNLGVVGWYVDGVSRICWVDLGCWEGLKIK